VRSATRLALVVLDRTVDLFGFAAGLVALAVSFVIFSDVITRRYFGFSTQGTDEIGGYALALCASWSLAYSLKTKAHCRIDSLTQYLPVRLRAYTDWLAYLVLLVVLIITTWQLWLSVALQFQLRTRLPSVLQIDLYIPQAAWAFGYLLFTVLALVRLLEATAALRAGRVVEVSAELGVRAEREEADDAVRTAAPVEHTETEGQ
jgi:TRAP-type C4-dicarboxylate transport system permease small subunit